MDEGDTADRRTRKRSCGLIICCLLLPALAALAVLAARGGSEAVNIPTPTQSTASFPSAKSNSSLPPADDGRAPVGTAAGGDSSSSDAMISVQQSAPAGSSTASTVSPPAANPLQASAGSVGNGDAATRNATTGSAVSSPQSGSINRDIRGDAMRNNAIELPGGTAPATSSGSATNGSAAVVGGAAASTSIDNDGVENKDKHRSSKRRAGSREKSHDDPLVVRKGDTPIPLFYIYIDRENKTSTVLPPHVNALLADIDRLLQRRVEVHVYTYSSLLPLVQRFDARLGAYFSQLNPVYGSMFANIGRAVLLHEYGGIYHDIRARISSANALNFFIEACSSSRNYSLIFETNPQHQRRIQLTNMVGCRRHSQLLEGYLQAIKTELRRVIVSRDTAPYSYFGTQILLDIIQSFATCQPVVSPSGADGGLRGRRLSKKRNAEDTEKKVRSECELGGERFVSSNFPLVQYDTEHTYHEEPTKQVNTQTAGQPLIMLPGLGPQSQHQARVKPIARMKEAAQRKNQPLQPRQPWQQQQR